MKRTKLIVLLLLLISLCSFTTIYNDQGTYNEIIETEDYRIQIIMFERLNGIQLVVTPYSYKDIAMKRLKEIAPNHSIKESVIRDNKYLFILASIDGNEIKEKE